MKRNWTAKTTVYLVFAVVAIAFMIYSLFSMAPDEPSVYQITTPTKQVSQSNFKKETFDLLPVERDPFFGTISKKTSSKPKKATKKKETKPWPSIRYNGMIENGKGTEKLFVLVINNKQQLLEKGTTVSDIKLLRGTPEKVTVSFQGETKEINQ